MSWPLRWRGKGQPRVQLECYEQRPAGGCAMRSRAVSRKRDHFFPGSRSESAREPERCIFATHFSLETLTRTFDLVCSACFWMMFPRRGSRPALGCQTWARARRVTCKHDSPTPPRKIVVTKRPTRGRYIRCHSDKNRYYT